MGKPIHVFVTDRHGKNTRIDLRNVRSIRRHRTRRQTAIVVLEVDGQRVEEECVYEDPFSVFVATVGYFLKYNGAA